MIPRPRALRFVVLLGFVSLLADVTYEGARSITGPYLGTLGAGAATVGLVAGLGELLGHGLRIASGWLADRTRAYWLLTLAGYAVNLAAVPLLALANRWEAAAFLIILERIGKAVRTPARDAMLAHATHSLGRGWGFGLHEAMDQIGALAGPLVVAAALGARGDYRLGFTVLAVPAAAALATLLFARGAYPRPEQLEVKRLELAGARLPRAFWLYLAAAGLSAAGYVDFPLIAWRLKSAGLAPDRWIPLFYSFAMAVDALSALIFGRLYDRHGPRVLIGASALAAGAMPLVLLGDFAMSAWGMALWGAGMGAHESILRAAVADLAPAHRRASAYGLFHSGYGAMWFLGSAAVGLLYSRSAVTAAVIAVVLHLAAALFFAQIRAQKSQ